MKVRGLHSPYLPARSLSLTALPSKTPGLEPSSSEPIASLFVIGTRLQRQEPNIIAPPGSSVIVIRVKDTPTDLRLVRIGDLSIQKIDVEYFDLGSRPSGGKVGQDTSVFIVSPGTWQIAGRGLVSFCLGSPTFQVKPGEAIFAGTFDAADIAHPSMDLAPVLATLQGSNLPNRLKPAQWTPGVFRLSVQRKSRILQLRPKNVAKPAASVA